ncbi:c-type cytochrome [Pseudorhodoplanes sp.]|uniref:c-type cytochrome n=2 Tax=Pseudorhodoplanes sp. TaxID=1934341 RepID=UPI002C197EB2|nr:c-type cytochrome [Pseudorhodoplanes sp.]HWV54798.1 c-type cytochrome [Pseudorhodoplanes sp.]
MLAAVLSSSGGAFAQTLTLPERIEQCGTCHGEDGNSKLENIPSLAGQPAFFTLNALILMREGVRKVEAMAPFVKDLKDADIQALAEHYEKLTPKPSGETIDPALAERGAKISAQRRCESCHLPSLAGQQQMPRLAKQRIDYMIYAMKQYLTDQRTGADTAMTASIFGLRDDDLAALAHYAAGK